MCSSYRFQYSNTWKNLPRCSADSLLLPCSGKDGNSISRLIITLAFTKISQKKSLNRSEVSNFLTRQGAPCKWTKHVGGEQKRNEGWQLLMHLGDTQQWMLLNSRMVSIPIFAAMAHPCIHAAHDTQLSCKGHRSQLSLSPHSQQLEKYAKVHLDWFFFTFYGT